MRIGVPAETLADEHRVALTPAGVRELTGEGHEVIIERAAGTGSRVEDGRYQAEGARLVRDGEDVFARADLILKVKAPTLAEAANLEPRHTLFAYLHLAACPELTHALVDSGATCIAYETVEDEHRRLPLLVPMSEVAGKTATQAGAGTLEKASGGRGVLLGGGPGVPGANVIVLGGGVVGANAASVAAGMGASVSLYDRNIDRLRELEVALAGRCSTRFASDLDIEEAVRSADLVIGAVLRRGARAPRLLTRAHLTFRRSLPCPRAICAPFRAGSATAPASSARRSWSSSTCWHPRRSIARSRAGSRRKLSAAVRGRRPWRLGHDLLRSRQAR